MERLSTTLEAWCSEVIQWKGQQIANKNARNNQPENPTYSTLPNNNCHPPKKKGWETGRFDFVEKSLQVHSKIGRSQVGRVAEPQILWSLLQVVPRLWRLCHPLEAPSWPWYPAGHQWNSLYPNHSWIVVKVILNLVAGVLKSLDLKITSSNKRFHE